MRDFKAEINEMHKNIEVISEVKNGATKIKCRCLIDDYEWETRPHDLLRGHGCHACNGVPRYTAETFKRKMKVINLNIEILGEYKRAHSKLKWKCKICSNIHETKPNDLLNGHGCSLCARETLTLKQRKTKDEFKKQVFSMVGEEYVILGDYQTTETDINFIHTLCGHEFKSRPHNFLSGTRCPKCNGGVRKKTTEYFQKEIENIDNGEYKFISEYKGNNKKSLFKHNECGSEFITTPESFLLQGTRCPECFFISKGELEIKKILEKYQTNYEQQKTFDDLKDVRKLRYDFFLPEYNLCVEYDGIQHFKPIDHWGGIEEFNKIKKRDHLKNAYCRDNNINLLRINYKEKNIRKVLEGVINV